jgi:hypothetical protein
MSCKNFVHDPKNVKTMYTGEGGTIEICTQCECSIGETSSLKPKVNNRPIVHTEQFKDYI